MSLNETALACLNRNRLLYLNMLEVLRRGSAELLWAGEGGVLLYDRGSGAYMLTARDRAALDGMLPLLPADCDLLVGHDLWYRDELAGRFGLWKEELCVQAAWTAPELSRRPGRTAPLSTGRSGRPARPGTRGRGPPAGHSPQAAGGASHPGRPGPGR